MPHDQHHTFLARPGPIRFKKRTGKGSHDSENMACLLNISDLGSNFFMSEVNFFNGTSAHLNSYTSTTTTTTTTTSSTSSRTTVRTNEAYLSHQSTAREAYYVENHSFGNAKNSFFYSHEEVNICGSPQQSYSNSGKSRLREERHGRCKRKSTSRRNGRSCDDSRNNPSTVRDEDAAFKESLHDAMADDEGAFFWESVYDVPLRDYISERFNGGFLESLTEDEYCSYIRSRMWERSHGFAEEQREQRKRRKHEACHTNKTQDYESGKSSGAHRRHHHHHYYGHRHGHSRPHHPDHDVGQDSDRQKQYQRYSETGGFKQFYNESGSDTDSGFGRSEWGAGRKNQRSTASSPSSVSSESSVMIDWRSTWQNYLNSWSEGTEPINASCSITETIVWPVASGHKSHVSSTAVREFYENVTLDVLERYAARGAGLQTGTLDHRSAFISLLKSERLRWHPDKIQQKLLGSGKMSGEHSSNGTVPSEQTVAEILQCATVVFQCADELLSKHSKATAR